MHREGALDTDAEADLADREGLADAPALPAMTMPAKTWIREREPSMTFTWTLTVSPGRKSGMSDRSEAASSASSVLM